MLESNNVMDRLNNCILQLKLINAHNINIRDESSEETNQESGLIKKIVECFDEILSDGFKIEEQPSPDSKGNKNHYWAFISKIFKSPSVLFCVINDKNVFMGPDRNENLRQKGENWIFLSILEKSFSDSINEIYSQGWDKIYYEKNSILRKHKTDIIIVLNELKQIKFNIKNKDYEKYLEFASKNNFYVDKEMSTFYSQIPESPIINNTPTQLMLNDISILPMLKNIDNAYINPNEHEINKDFICERNNDYYPKKNENFYSFNPNSDTINLRNEDDDLRIDNRNNSNNNININFSFDGFYFIKSSKFMKHSQGLVINPKRSKFLPTDNL